MGFMLSNACSFVTDHLGDPALYCADRSVSQINGAAEAVLAAVMHTTAPANSLRQMRQIVLPVTAGFLAHQFYQLLLNVFRQV